jgi:hypothetical protein
MMQSQDILAIDFANPSRSNSGQDMNPQIAPIVFNRSRFLVRDGILGEVALGEFGESRLGIALVALGCRVLAISSV